MRFLIVFLFLCGPALAYAATQDWAGVRRDAEAMIRRDLAGARLVLRWDPVEPPKLPACARVEYAWPGAARGKVFVQARCTGPQTWQVRLPAWISLTGEIAFTARPLPKETRLQAGDLTWQEVELARFPDDVLNSETEALGRMLKQPVQGGQVLRKSYLREPYAVRRQQTVKLRVQMESFSITSEGVAQSDAADGEPVRVKTRSGALIEGTARAGGIVEVAP